MFDVCPACGIYDEAKTIDHTGSHAICPHCQYPHPFVHLPLYVVTGASGVGKTTVCLHMPTRTRDYVFLESDIFWQPVFNTPESDYAPFQNYCLRAAKNIAQAGRPVVLYGSVVPLQYARAPQRRYFTTLHYLALVCEKSRLVERLKARPAWRDSASTGFITRMVTFNQWFVDHVAEYPDMTLLDTTALALEDTLIAVENWLQSASR